MAEQISFFNATNLPPEVAAKLKSLQQQEQVANAMLAKGMQPVEPVPTRGNLAIPISPLQGAASLVNAYFGAKGNADVAKGFGEAAQQYQTGSEEALKSYLNTRTGAPAAGPIDGMASPRASTPSDPFGAAATAAGSTYPLVHQLGMADLTQQLKQGVTPEDLLKLPAEAYTGDSKVAAASAAQRGMKDPWKLLVVKPEYMSVGDRVLNKADMNAPPVRDFSKKYELNEDGSTKIYWQVGADGQKEPYQREVGSGQLHKLDQAPKTTIQNMPGPKQQTAFAQALGPIDAKALGANRDVAQHLAGTGAQTLTQIRQAIDSDKTITGPGASVITALTRIGYQLGFTGPEALAQTKKLLQGQADSSLQMALKIKNQGSITNYERRSVEATAAGKQWQTVPEILEAVKNLDSFMRKTIQNYNTQLELYKQSYPDSEFGTFTVQEPPPYEGPFDQYKQKPPGAASDPFQQYKRK